MKSKPTVPRILLGSMLRSYFCEYLVSQRDLSPRTIAGYRDTFRLLLTFLERRYRVKPDVVGVDDLEAPRVLAFLDDLERRRGNTARTRNARRAAKLLLALQLGATYVEKMHVTAKEIKQKAAEIVHILDPKIELFKPQVVKEIRSTIVELRKGKLTAIDESGKPMEDEPEAPAKAGDA